MNANLIDIIIKTAKTFSNRIAYSITERGKACREITFNTVFENAQSIALFLSNMGVGSQEPVGIYANNSPEWAITFSGIILNNSTVVPIDVNSGSAELEHIINDTGIKTVFAASKLLPNLEPYNLDLIVLIDKQDDLSDAESCKTLESITADHSDGWQAPKFREDDVAIIIYTSGTTAAPKGVMLTHPGLLSNIDAIIHDLKITEEDRFLSVIGLSHTFELTCGLILPLCVGATVTYSESLKYTTIFKNMGSAAPTLLLSVPLLFKILLEQAVSRVTGKRGLSICELVPDDIACRTAAEQAQKVFGGKLRYCVSGGAPLATSIANGFKELGITMLQGYGLTEVSGVATITRASDRSIESVGKPLPHVEMKIKNPDGTGKGEVLFRGISVMKGYSNNPQATKECIENGWFHTGDIGYINQDANLVICGRSKNLIVTSAGVNVHPEELEERIQKSPYIKEVCVIGKQRPDRTETIHAVIVPKLGETSEVSAESEQRTSDELYEMIAEEVRNLTADLASYKNVHSMQVRYRELPRGRTKKVQREQVKRESFSIQGRLGHVEEKGITPLVLINGTLVTPFRVAEKHCIVLENGRISQLGTYDSVYLPPGADVIDVNGAIISPGFIDLHVHGGKGAAFNQGSKQDFDRIIDYYIQHGTTLMLATLYIDEKSVFLRTIEQISEYCRKPDNRVLHGIHLEGPFINPVLRGALNEEYIWRATNENWFLLRDAGQKMIRMMTLAPEMPGIDDVMQLAAQDDVVVGIAHSEARYEDIEISIDNGLTQVTHVFNAMHPLHHRTPGILTAALLKRELKVHLIADGVHVHPAVIEMLYKMKGPSGIVLITDGVMPSGQEDGLYDMAGKETRLRNGRVYLPDGTLAGSTVTMESSIRNLVTNTKIPFDEAIRMASLNPARVLGLDHRKGVLAVGRDADIVVLNHEYRVNMTIIGGEIVYKSV